VPGGPLAATGASKHGAVVCGHFAGHAFRWSAPTGLVDLGAYLPQSDPHGMTPDGRILIVASYCRGCGGLRWFRVTFDDGEVD